MKRDDDDPPATEMVVPFEQPGAGAVTIGKFPWTVPGGLAPEMSDDWRAGLRLLPRLCHRIAAACGRAPYPFTEEQRQDLGRRLVEADEHPTRGAPWQEVRERIWHGR